MREIGTWHPKIILVYIFLWKQNLSQKAYMFMDYKVQMAYLVTLDSVPALPKVYEVGQQHTLQFSQCPWG